MKIPKEINIEIFASEDEADVRGNVMASGDDAIDKLCEDKILKRLRNGDVWAWALVEVRATKDCPTCGQKQIASTWLGGCSHKNENDFIKNSGYYEQMVEEAILLLETSNNRNNVT